MSSTDHGRGGGLGEPQTTPSDGYSAAKRTPAGWWEGGRSASNPELHGGFSDHHTPTPLPTMIGDYRLVARIGGGSMGDLDLAHKMSPYGFVHRAVIKRVKRSRADYKQLQRMLLDEARATACFHHPNLAAIFDVGEYEDGVYLAIEYVDGTDLRQVNGRLRSRREALPFEIATYLVGEVLRGLHHAHTALDFEGKPLDIIHRDVNPANILISYHGHVKLVDFGVVRMRDRVQAATEPGLVKGKYAYLAPEYIAGEPCSIQTDVYAAGVMLFELLTGRECFTGDSAYEVMWKVVNRGVPLYRLEREGAPDDLIRIVERATHTVPERRYPTAQDLANVLEAWLIRSRRHATAWVLSVFFARHGLFPRPREELAVGTVPLAMAEQALVSSRATSPNLDLIFEAPVESHEPRSVGLEATPMPLIDLSPRSFVASDPGSTDLPMPDEAMGLLTEAQTTRGGPGAGVLAPIDAFVDAPLATPARSLSSPSIVDQQTVPMMVAPPLGLQAASRIRDGELYAELRDLAPDALEEAPGEESETHGLEGADERPLLTQGPGRTTQGSSWTGSLETNSSVEVLDTLRTSASSGVLELRCGLIWKRVQIFEGLPVSITSNMGMELIGEHLVKERMISRRDLERCLEAADLESATLTSKLIEFEFLAREDLETALGRNLAARLDEALEWRWGTFDFLPQPIHPPEILPNLDLEELIARARERRSQSTTSSTCPAEGERAEERGEGSVPDQRLERALGYAKTIANSTGRGRKDELGA